VPTLPHRARWSRGTLSREHAELVLLHGSDADRELLARNPELPHDLQHHLLEHSLTLALNPALCPDLQLRFVSDPRLLDHALKGSALDARAQRLLLESPDLLPWHRTALLNRRNLDPVLRDELLEALSTTCSAACECDRLARADVTPWISPVHQRLLATHHPRTHFALAWGPDLDRAVASDLREAALTEVGTSSPHPAAFSILPALASRGHLPPDVLERLARSSHPAARASSTQAQLPEHLADLLVEDPVEFVRVSLAKSPRLPPVIQHRLALSGVPEVNEELARREDLAPDLLARFTSPLTLVTDVATNPALDAPTLERLVLENRSLLAEHISFALALLNHHAFELFPQCPVDLLLSYRPALLFDAAHQRGLDPEVLDALLDSFAGTVGELFDVVTEFSA
jgi:hypothetical protein